MKMTLCVNTRLIDSEQKRSYQKGYGWERYYTISEIYRWLDDKLAEYPEILTDLTVGTSFENRTIRAVRLSQKQVSFSIVEELCYKII